MDNAELKATVIASLEEKLPVALKEIVDPIVEAKVNAALETAKATAATMAQERAVFGHDRSGLTTGQKMAFIEKVKSVIEVSPESAGGALIPTEHAAGILRIAETIGLFPGLFKQMPMRGVKQMLVPRYTGSVLSGSYVGMGTVGTSQTVASFGNALLVKQTWATFFRVSNEMLQYASESVADFLMTLVAEGLSYNLENQAFNGTGAPFVGVLVDADVQTFTLVSGHDTFAELDVDDCKGAIAMLKPTSLAGAAWFFHRSVFALLGKQKASSGEYLLDTTLNSRMMSSTGEINPRPAAYLLGYPVYLSEALPSTTAISTKFAVFGNMQNMLFGTGNEMTMQRSDSATVDGVNVFAANQTALRFTHDHALALGLPSGLVALKTNSA